MKTRSQIVDSAMRDNVALARQFGLCPAPFISMREEYRSVVRRERRHILLEVLLLAALITSVLLPNCCAEGLVEPQTVALREPYVFEAESTIFAAEYPDESERILEAIKAKSAAIDDCIITGYCADCVTAYAHMNQDDRGRVLTASGQWVYPGACVATDPDVIPTGSTVIIGDKTYIALDTGVKGNHVDILMTHDEAAAAGVRRQTVWWCEELG